VVMFFGSASFTDTAPENIFAGEFTVSSDDALQALLKLRQSLTT